MCCLVPHLHNRLLLAIMVIEPVAILSCTAIKPVYYSLLSPMWALGKHCLFDLSPSTFFCTVFGWSLAIGQTIPCTGLMGGSLWWWHIAFHLKKQVFNPYMKDTYCTHVMNSWDRLLNQMCTESLIELVHDLFQLSSLDFPNFMSCEINVNTTR